MNRKSQIVLIAGLALATPCMAQSAADAANAYRSELAANVADNSSSLTQADPVIKVSGQIQFRYVYNARKDVPPAATAKDNAQGFQTRRTKIKFSGKLSEQWSYKVNGAFSKSSGSFKLEDAYADYKTENGLKIRAGQFKLPYMREELVSSSRQLAAERSITNEFFNQGRSQGIQVSNLSENFRWAVAFSDGINTINTDFTSDDEADYAFTGRVEYMFAGDDWDRFKDFTSWQNSDYAGIIGAAIHYQAGGESFADNAAGATTDASATGVTADVSVEGNGWNAYIAGNFQNIEPPVGSDIENTGLVVQGGYMVNPKWEIFGRYDMLFSDQVDDFSTITAGANHYFILESHAAKFTGDVQFFLDTESTSDAPMSTSTALLSSDEDSQWAVRLQMQILF